MMTLTEERTQPVHEGTPPLSPEEVVQLAQQVPDWRVRWNAIERDYAFPDFRGAIGFVNQVAELAETENHHPDMQVAYNKVHLELSTHSVGGLSRNDFILAAKISQLQ